MDAYTFAEAGDMYYEEGGRDPRTGLKDAFRAMTGDPDDKPLTTKKRTTLRKAYMRGYRRARKRDKWRENPAVSLPVGKLVTVRAKRLKNGRIELYGL